MIFFIYYTLFHWSLYFVHSHIHTNVYQSLRGKQHLIAFLRTIWTFDRTRHSYAYAKTIMAPNEFVMDLLSNQ